MRRLGEYFSVLDSGIEVIVFGSALVYFLCRHRHYLNLGTSDAQQSKSWRVPIQLFMLALQAAIYFCDYMQKILRDDPDRYNTHRMTSISFLLATKIAYMQLVFFVGQYLHVALVLPYMAQLQSDNVVQQRLKRTNYVIIIEFHAAIILITVFIVQAETRQA